MIEDKIKLINSREEVESYLRINGISGKAKDFLITKWEEFQEQKVELEIEEPEVPINEIKNSIVDVDSVESKEE